MLGTVHYAREAVQCYAVLCNGRYAMQWWPCILQVTASASQNADLLAAMRGAGSVFGVVTELAFKVYDVADYHGGVILFADDINCTIFRCTPICFLSMSHTPANSGAVKLNCWRREARSDPSPQDGATWVQLGLRLCYKLSLRSPNDTDPSFFPFLLSPEEYPRDCPSQLQLNC